MTQIVEPCESCGEDTDAGSANFIGRRRISTPAGALAFLCSDCDERIRVEPADRSVTMSSASSCEAAQWP